MRQRLIFLFTVLTFYSASLQAQNDSRPTLRFASGDVVTGATGVSGTIPDNWSGILPRGTELFLLVPNDGSNGEIYISVKKSIPLEQRKANWLAGLDLDNGNILKSDGNIFTRDGGGLATNLVLAQKTSDRQGYIELNCGGEYCLTATLLASPTDFEKLKKVLFSFLDTVKWGEPGDFKPYTDFDWHEFLSGKHILNKDYIQKGKSQNDLWLCPDGTFTSKLKRTGLAKKQAKEYKGTNKGTWETTSVGPTGTLILKYKKLPVLEIALEIRDEQIYLNDKRHYAIAATVCGGK
jgi:hypothetical protein